MNKIAIWYHCRLSGGHPHIDSDHANRIMSSQMDALVRSGLLSRASEFMIGCNGGERNVSIARRIAPASARFLSIPDTAQSELSTLYQLQQWLVTHPDWFVFYHHSKCATRKDTPCSMWRRCMENKLVWRWGQCINDLLSGSDSAGCHWLTPEQYPGMVYSPYWGGNFWWSKTNFLLLLPPLPDTAKNRPDFYIAESWIGTGPIRPKVTDYCPRWPTSPGCCR